MQPMPKPRRVVPVSVVVGRSLLAGERWQDYAACAAIDPELWFPLPGGNPREPKRICREMCPVREACLDAAGPNDYGLWGGLSDRERRRLHKGEPGWERRR